MYTRDPKKKKNMTTIINLNTKEDIKNYLLEVRKEAIFHRTYATDGKRIDFWQIEENKVTDKNIELFQDSLEDINLVLLKIHGCYVFCSEQHVALLTKIPQQDYNDICSASAA